MARRFACMLSALENQHFTINVVYLEGLGPFSSKRRCLNLPLWEEIATKIATSLFKEPPARTGNCHPRTPPKPKRLPLCDKSPARWGRKFPPQSPSKTQEPQRSSQGIPKSPQGAPKSPKGAPKRRQNAPKLPPRVAQESPNIKKESKKASKVVFV